MAVVDYHYPLQIGVRCMHAWVISSEKWDNTTRLIRKSSAPAWTPFYFLPCLANRDCITRETTSTLRLTTMVPIMTSIIMLRAAFCGAAALLAVGAWEAGGNGPAITECGALPTSPA